jgi:hypothetical protein
VMPMTPSKENTIGDLKKECWRGIKAR